ncbi:glycosyltransferase [Candidatus Roizmanbacteria bacterium]|nr:glycosyltransferase [Candidatus Roizmanbacteria bacterium]
MTIEGVQTSNKEVPNILLRRPLDLSIVIRCGRDRNRLDRCISSIDENVEIVVSAADDAPFLEELRVKGYKVASHRYGNWSIAAQAGINTASNDDVIMMDVDSIFGEGAIRVIDTALKEGQLLVQPRIIFLSDGTPISRIVTQAREYENQREPKSYSPGLGLKVSELTEKIGVEGNVYNLSVAYGDDGDLDQRRRAAGIDVYVAEEALLYHDSISFEHELKTAYRFGVGERQTQAGNLNPKTLVDILREEFISDEAKKYYDGVLAKYGIPTMAFMMLCRSAYMAGFFIEDKRR